MSANTYIIAALLSTTYLRVIEKDTRLQVVTPPPVTPPPCYPPKQTFHRRRLRWNGLRR